MDKDPHKGYCIPYGEEGAEGHRRGERGLQAGRQRRHRHVRAREHQAVRRDRAEQRLRAVDHADGGGHGQAGAEEARAPTPRRSNRCSARASWTSSTSGGGVVCLHFAIAANRHWPEFKELFGGDVHRAPLDRGGRRHGRGAGASAGGGLRREGLPHHRRDLRVRAALRPREAARADVARPGTDQHGRPLDQSQGQTILPSPG